MTFNQQLAICEMSKFVGPDFPQSEDFIENVDHNYYSKLKPSLFMLRYLGGPPGLWRLHSKRSEILTIVTQTIAFLTLVVLNVGSVFGFYMIIGLVQQQDHVPFQQKTFVFFALFLELTGIIGNTMLCLLKDE